MTTVFIGQAGVAPPFPPTAVGEKATNQATGERWFVNLNMQWQLQIGK